jgi:cation channel sperm-associated protein subunit gamma
LVLVTFNPPVNFYRWKMEVLQIQMEAAPFRNKGEPQGLETEGKGLPMGVSDWRIPGSPVPQCPLHPADECLAAEVCGMSWYTPMPIKNGSVVMRVEVSTNGLGPYIPPKRCFSHTG